MMAVVCHDMSLNNNHIMMEENQMSINEKLNLLEDVFEMDEGTLKPEMNLTEIEQWNSMTKLSLIVLMEDECGKELKSDDIRKFATVDDILSFMG